MDERSSGISEPSHPTLEDWLRVVSAPANPRTMFFLLLPAGTWVANVIGALMASSAGRDANDIGSAFFIAVLLPVAFICLIVAVRQAIRKRQGGSAFVIGMMWNLLLVAAVWAIMSVAVQNAKGKRQNRQDLRRPSAIPHGTP